MNNQFADKKKFEKKIIAEVDAETLNFVKNSFLKANDVYLLGGCLRSLYYGLEPNDYDFKIFFSFNDPQKSILAFKKQLKKSFIYKLIDDHDFEEFRVLRVFNKKSKIKIDLAIYKLSSNPLTYYFKRNSFLKTSLTLNSIYFDLRKKVFFDLNNGFGDLSDKNLIINKDEVRSNRKFFICLRIIYLYSQQRGFKLDNKTKEVMKESFISLEKFSDFMQTFIAEKNNILSESYFSAIFGGLAKNPDLFWEISDETGFLKLFRLFLSKKLNFIYNNKKLVCPKWSRNHKANILKLINVLVDNNQIIARKATKTLKIDSYFN